MSDRPELCAVCSADEPPAVDKCETPACCCDQSMIWHAGYARAMAEVRATIARFGDPDAMRLAIDVALDDANAAEAALAVIVALTEPKP